MTGELRDVSLESGYGNFAASARSAVFVSSSSVAIAAPERGECAMSKIAAAIQVNGGMHIHQY